MKSSKTLFSAQDYRRISLSHINTEYVVLGDDLILLYRSPCPKEATSIVDVFGSCWVFLSGCLAKNQVKVRLGDGQIISIDEGNFSAYIPPFSLVEWQLAAGPLHVEMLTCTRPPFSSWKAQPMLWQEPQEGTLFEAFDIFLKNGIPKEAININRFDFSCALSAKAKSFILQNFEEPIVLGDLAKKFKTSPAVLSRYFKKAVGLPPIKFMNQVRVMDSLRHLLLKEMSVWDTSTEVGFSLIRQYYENFHKIMNTAPSAFLSSQSTREENMPPSRSRLEP